MPHHYTDYFTINQNYSPIMRRENLQTSPDMWLDFYPHHSFTDFLRSLLKQMSEGQKSVWLTGAFGTGKTYAALVTQKLLNADDQQVGEYLTKRKEELTDTVKASLKEIRKNGVLCVFDTGSDSVGAKEQFLVRIETAITKELENNKKFTIPPRGNLESIIERVKDEGNNFFKTRDEIQDKLAHLTSAYKTFSDLEKGLKIEKLRDNLLSDTLTVFRKRSIYLDLSSQSLLHWIENVLTTNGLKKLVFIWDEFSSYVDRNRRELKTLEELAEAAQDGKFYFVPITHTNISAYHAIGSESAKKANDRFEFRHLDMPNDTAFRLAADAFKVVPEKETEWEHERSQLWHGIQDVVDIHFTQQGEGDRVTTESFKKILPIHPFAAFVLKHLSTFVGSNQRSLFDYLKGNADGAEFQEFITSGGPAVSGKQYLTVDHLWKYFIERDDLGLTNEVSEARREFCRYLDLTKEEKRVFRAVLLFTLLARLSKEGNELLKPTVKNVVESFKGDGELIGVEQVLINLERQHCFTLVDGRIEMYHSNVNTKELEKEKEEIRTKFNSLVLGDVTKNTLDSKIKHFNTNGRFVVRVGSVDSFTGTIQHRENFSPDDGGQILVQFILAKNQNEQLRIPEKIESLAKQYAKHRIVFLTMPITFCDNDSDLWEKYITQAAQIQLSTDATAKTIHRDALKRYNDDWTRRITENSQTLHGHKISSTSAEISQEDLTWNTLKNFLLNFVEQTLPCCVDKYSGYSHNALGNPTGLRQWAKAGILFTGTGASNQGIDAFKKNGISNELAWFEEYPQHPLAIMRNLCKEKKKNTVGKNSLCSIRKIYIELQRPPYGLQCNPYSAFVLGFILKEWLNDNLQWTNGQITCPLDVETFAEIIEAVVKDNGGNNINAEKLICRISKEEKAFIEKAGELFGINIEASGTVASTLNVVQSRIAAVSNKVPLWALKTVIQSSTLKNVIDNLCKALAQSSIKKRAENEPNYIQEIGKSLLEDNELVGEFGKLINTDKFEESFHEWVDAEEPNLKLLAEQVGDLTGRYYQALKNKCAETAGWLWNQGDYRKILDEVKQEYAAVCPIKSLLNAEHFLPYNDAVSQLRKSIFEKNKVPVSIIIQKYPSLETFFEAVKTSNAFVLSDSLKQYETLIKQLFIDIGAKQSQINILAEQFADIPYAKETLGEIYEKLPDGLSIELLKENLNDHLANSLVTKIRNVWKEKMQSNSPDDWVAMHKIPARYLSVSVDEIRRVLISPTDFTTSKLQTVLDELKGLKVCLPSDIDVCRKQFVAEVVPNRYAKLEFDANELCGEIYNLPPEKLNSAVVEFIRKRYQKKFHKQVAEKIKSFSEKELRELLTKFAENPDVGLVILEEGK